MFLPAYSLAFEYQGEQHFHYNELFGSMNKQMYQPAEIPEERREERRGEERKAEEKRGNIILFRKLDNYKQSKCKELGITLIYIPYWWNRSVERYGCQQQQQQQHLRVITTSLLFVLIGLFY